MPLPSKGKNVCCGRLLAEWSARPSSRGVKRVEERVQGSRRRRSCPVSPRVAGEGDAAQDEGFVVPPRATKAVRCLAQTYVEHVTSGCRFLEWV